MSKIYRATFVHWWVYRLFRRMWNPLFSTNAVYSMWALKGFLELELERQDAIRGLRDRRDKREAMRRISEILRWVRQE